MSSLFGSKQQKIDTSATTALRKDQQEEKAQRDSEIATRRAGVFRRGRGRQSLITGAETGIPLRVTLG